MLEPGTGALGSPGEWGVGRLPEPPELLAAVEARARRGGGDLDGLRRAGHRGRHARADRRGALRRQPLLRAAWASRSPRRPPAAAPSVTVVAANVGAAAPPGVRYVDVGTAAELPRPASASSSRRRAADGRRRRRLPARRPRRGQDQEDRGRRGTDPRARAYGGRALRARRAPPPGPGAGRLRRRARRRRARLRPREAGAQGARRGRGQRRRRRRDRLRRGRERGHDRHAATRAPRSATPRSEVAARDTGHGLEPAFISTEVRVRADGAAEPLPEAALAPRRRSTPPSRVARRIEDNIRRAVKVARRGARAT